MGHTDLRHLGVWGHHIIYCFLCLVKCQPGKESGEEEINTSDFKTNIFPHRCRASCTPLPPRMTLWPKKTEQSFPPISRPASGRAPRKCEFQFSVYYSNGVKFHVILTYILVF